MQKFLDLGNNTKPYNLCERIYYHGYSRLLG